MRGGGSIQHPYLEHRDVVAGEIRRPGRTQRQQQQQQRQEVDGHARGEAHDVGHVEKNAWQGAVAVAVAEGWQDAYDHLFAEGW